MVCFCFRILEETEVDATAIVRAVGLLAHENIAESTLESRELLVIDRLLLIVIVEIVSKGIFNSSR